MTAAFSIRFWGVRGSIPCPGPTTVRYGGNTTCIELRVGEDRRLVIIDAGSGIRELGNHLIAHELPQGPINTEIFLSHTHWDHIMGFPFFAPIYIPGTRLKVSGPVSYEDDSLDRIVGDQLRYRYFPVRQAELAASIRYEELKEGTFDLGGGLTVRTKYLNHPILDLGYRFEYAGASFVTCFDTEPFRNVFATDAASDDYDEETVAEGAQAAQEENDKVQQFISGADLIVYDAQYTQKEYETNRVGWGHSSFEYAVTAANRANVKHLALMHHDPLRTDDELDALQGRLRQAIEGKTDMEVTVAAEGLIIDLPSADTHTAQRTD